MHYFQDTGFLLLYCMSSLLYLPADPAFVLAFLCALIFCCVCFFWESPLIQLGLGILFVSASLVFLPFLCFFPVVSYIFLRERSWMFLSGFVLLFFCHFLHPAAGAWVPLWLNITGFLLAALLQSHTGQYERLNELFRKSQDDSRENQLLLTEKNKILLEKQDQEVYTATLQERNRIAREIHDNVGHLLSRSILLLGAARALNRQTELCPMLDNLGTSLDSAMDSIRSSVHDLHDDSIDLEEAVRSLITGFSFCPIVLHYDMGRTVPSEIKYCFINIIKEALSNVIKHSNARSVRITLQEHPALYQLCIEDNGTRIGTACCRRDSSQNGIGLANMRDRIEALKGAIQISTDSGFRIFITIPKEYA